MKAREQDEDSTIEMRQATTGCAAIAATAANAKRGPRNVASFARVSHDLGASCLLLPLRRRKRDSDADSVGDSHSWRCFYPAARAVGGEG